MAQRSRRLLLRLLAILVAAATASTGLGLAVAEPTAAAARSFTPVFAVNTAGDIMLRGNTLLTCQPSASNCQAAQDGASSANNAFAMGYVDVDDDTTTFNSSSASVVLPAGSTVLYAGLTWAAMTSAGSATGTVPAGVAAPNPASRGSVKFMPPGSAYSTLTSSATDLESNTTYQAYANVTTAVAAAGSGVYTVADVQAGTGADRFAGWSLVIAYRDITEPTRNLVVYTGFGSLNSSTRTLPIAVSGFTTPLTGSVVTRLGAVAYEGDKGSLGDGLTLGSSSILNDLNPVNDVFNSSITDLGETVPGRTPSFVNQLGFDIDRFDATGVLANGATSTTITLTTAGEAYYPGVITFATDLYSPVLTADKAVTDVNGGDVLVGDVLDYSIEVTNTGADAATLSVLSDVVPSGTVFVGGSLTLDGVEMTDTTGDDAADITGSTITTRLGPDATSSTGGRMAIGAEATVGFRVQVGAGGSDASAIVNVATLSYSSETTGAALTGSSNSVASALVVPPVLTVPTPPAATVGASYSLQPTVAGGTGPYVWAVSAGTPPAGLEISSSTGLISGIPTAAESATFDVSVTDANGRSDSAPVTIVVDRMVTSVAVAASDSAVPFGTSVTLTATVSPPSASGTVTFESATAAGGTTTLGATGLSAGTATLALPLPRFGANTITAIYDGDAAHASATSATTVVDIHAYVGELIVTEFRTSGPGGVDDSYIELYNTGAALPLDGFVISTATEDIVVPEGTGQLGSRRSYLITGSEFSLGAVAHSDLQLSSLGSGGVRVTAPDTAGTQTDAVGPVDGFHSGTPLPSMSGSPSDEHAWVRLVAAGRPRDSADNAADFKLVSTVPAVSVGGVTPTLGAPSPTGRVDPYQGNVGAPSTLLDVAVGGAAAPNRSSTTGPSATLTVRRTITNVSDVSITAAQLRVTALSEVNGVPQPGVAQQPARVANLRIIDPDTPTSSIPLSDGTVATVHNLSVDAPNAADPGGGLNSTLTIPLESALAPGDTVDVAVTFAVDTRGTFWFGYDVETTTSVVADDAVDAHVDAHVDALAAPPLFRRAFSNTLDAGSVTPARSAQPPSGGLVRS